MASLRFALAATILVTAGCFGDPRPAPPPDAAADAPSDDLVAPPADIVAPDAPADDAVDDRPAPTDDAFDAPSITDAVNEITDAVSEIADAVDDVGGCARDEHCVDPAARVCDTSSGRCVQCLDTRDTCPADQHCDPAARLCVPGCRSDEGCAGGADGGARRCDTARHACIECAEDAQCPLTTICVMGACVPGCNPQRGCPSGETCCGGTCHDILADTGHCGACDRACVYDNAGATCRVGACDIGACNESFADCNRRVDDGCEVNTRTDVTNCGTCGTRCPTPANAASVACVAGRCGFACATGFADCNGASADGCEVDTRVDVRACGRCGTVCPTAPRAPTATCVDGRCGLRCEAGAGDCDGDMGNGCEATITTDPLHCGACGNACAGGAHARPSCAMGRCGLLCDAGFGDCDGDLANGCETDLSTTVAHCGACGTACNAPGGTPACVAGRCAVASCGGVFADCDGRPANGCESDTRRDAANCGRCGAACPAPPNTVPQCNDAVCGVVCAAGFGDCDGVATNGCELDLRTSTAHCGVCNRACSAPMGTPACRGGNCAVASCSAGFGDCDGNAANGCETNLSTSPAHCGACGVRQTETCDGVDNTCDGRADEGCPVSLDSLDTLTYTSPTWGTRTGVAYDQLCPAGSFVRGMSGRVSSYLTQIGVQCARPRLVEDRSVTPFRYTIALDNVAGPAPSGVASGTTWSFTCPGTSLASRIDGRYSGSVIYQVSFDCWTWEVTGTPATGFRVTRTHAAADSPLFGPSTGTAFTYDCPSSPAASSLREFLGTYRPTLPFYVSALSARCTQPTLGVR